MNFHAIFGMDRLVLSTVPGALLRWGQGYVPPDSLVALPRFES